MALSKQEFYIRDLVIDDEYGIIDSNATIQEAAKKMKELGVPDLVVVEGETQKVLGVIADFDIVQNVVAEGSDPKTKKVISTMYTITPVTLDTPVEEAFIRMRDLHVNVVPVIENEKLIGVATIHDCWSYIPDKIVDKIGLIPVRNTKVAEFWFASACAIIAFVLGILLPTLGVFSYFTGDLSDLEDFLSKSFPLGGKVTFHVFEARGVDFFVQLIDLISTNGEIWLVVVIIGILMLIFGIIGLISIIYASFSNVKNYHTGYLIQYVIPSLMLAFMVLEWIFYAIGFATAEPPVDIKIDGIGLTFSIISMLLILGAIFRDYIFREIESPQSEVDEVKE
ncbi:MAG: CBS domain-containing protein [Promethearchaeota archaeon]